MWRGDPASQEHVADRYWELYDYHGRLEEKYATAASRPWLPVEPDPPEPK